MTDLPVRFPHDPWCRAGSRLMLTLDGGTGNCFLGLTPDGKQPGRDMLAGLTLWRGDSQLPYKAAQENGAMVLCAESGYLSLRLGFPERLVIQGEGVSLLIGKGRSLGIFMSGGSAVDDSRPGALYVTSGARMRIVPKTGSVEVRSAWDLNALSDPSPQVFLHPDDSGALEAAVYVSDFDCAPEESDAPGEPEDFRLFLQRLTSYPSDEDALHAAYVVWSCLQPARALADPQITAPLYVSNRRTLGTARLSDNVLLAALLSDPAEAARQLCSFLPYMDDNGLVPREADNRSRLYEAETPYFGLVMKARPDVLDAISLRDYELLRRALNWWLSERRCDDGSFYYLHRYEPGLGKRTVPEALPGLSSLLNACMGMWMDAMAVLTEKYGKQTDADIFRTASENLPAAIRAEEPVPAALELPMLLAADQPFKAQLAKRVMQSEKEFTSLRGALTRLAAGLSEGGCSHAD